MNLKAAIVAACLVLTFSTTGLQADEKTQQLYNNALPYIMSPITLGRMIIGGQGMAILSLGTPFSRVVSDFGEPIDIRTTGFLGKNNHWLYQADDGTTIIVSGKDTVKKISLRGGTNSTFMTVEGVSFGMEYNHIVAHYGQAELEERPQGILHTYPAKGLEFMVNAGRVTQIIVREADVSNTVAENDS